MPKSKINSLPDFKSRSPMYLRNMSDEVQTVLSELAKDLKQPRWLIMEKILEAAFNLDSNVQDVKVLLGIKTKKPKYRG